MSGGEEWLICALNERGHGDVYLWWCPNYSGYTRYIEHAGRYTEEEARRAVDLRTGLGLPGSRHRDGAAAFRWSEVKAKALSVVPIGTLCESKDST